ncbi:hypothetical protein RclHR1_03290009 [Rhizophagus clarus]|uniref:F-box domain-containing protein n=1 Tax=Rhizophagus clarus TaxID=94130 RepID=A0A2Z6RQ06_9GLOM|nr:hypothetical protein RclHR1_03290009 [Rhizophagus clarus]GES84013.1 hypothetical protein GLOIN_2v1876445 [Rhizophagus clarus]
MTCQLIADCLDEILEYLEEDWLTLHSCLLVNRLWCELTVKILWRNIWNFKNFKNQITQLRAASSILSTLISCFPNESKELLYKNNILISPPTSKPPLFNYAAYCRVLSTYGIDKIVNNVLDNKSLLNHKRDLVANEIFKLFASQISSLKKLIYHHNDYYYIDFSFNYFPGAKDLSELCCVSSLPSNFFYQLSQVCNNLQSISINIINGNISNELKELISLQNNLKNITLIAFHGNWSEIIPVLMKHSNTLIKLCLYSDDDNLPLLFISLFPNLQEILLSFPNIFHIFENFKEFEASTREFKDFKKLQYVNFPKLQTLKIPFHCPKTEYIINFLENNGKTLKKLYISRSDKVISLSVANFCPNIKSLYIIFKNDELDILKTIFISCQCLESIKITCGIRHLNKKKVLETVTNYSPKNFHELKIYSSSYSDISSEDLESFFISWKNRIPKKLLTLIMIKGDFFTSLDMKIIKKYENFGIIKFKIKRWDDEEEEEEFFKGLY